MNLKKLTYDRIADIAMAADAGDPDDMPRATLPGDLTDEIDLATAILHRWARVARFNIGTTQTLRIMEQVASDMDEVSP